MFLEGLLLAFASRAQIPIVPIQLGPLLDPGLSTDCEALLVPLVDTRRELGGSLPRRVLDRLGAEEEGWGVCTGDVGDMIEDVVDSVEALSCNDAASDGDKAPF